MTLWFKSLQQTLAFLVIWLGKMGSFGGMYGCFWCFEGVRNGHRWITKGPLTQARWFEGGKLFFGRFQPTVM